MKMRKLWMQTCRNHVIGVLTAVLVVAVFLPVSAFGETAYDLIWLKQFWGAASGESASTLAVDKQGNSYVAGTFSQAGGSGEGVFLAKYSASGEELWVKPTGWGRVVEVKLVLDADGNIFLTGSSFYTVGGSWPPTETGDVLLAKFTNSGENLWVKQLETPELEFAGGVAVDAAGHVFITGQTYGSLEAGNANLGAADIFVGAFDAATGGKLWVKQFGSAGYDQKGGIAVDCSGNVFVTGTSSTGTSRGSILVKMAASTGEMLWMNPFGGDKGNAAADLATDANGNVLVTGSTYGAMEEGRIPSGEIELYVAKFSGSTGATLWVKQFGTGGVDYSSRDLEVDGDGNVLVAGQKEFLWGQWRSDTFLAKFSGETGQQLWEKLLNSDVDNYGYAVAVDSTGKVLLVGMTRGVMEDGKTNDGSSDFFLAKFGPAAKTPAEQIALVVSELQQGLVAGTVYGSGPGNSADGREGALLNMLLSAEKMIVSGEAAAACGQLSDAYLKLDAMALPADFIAGPAVTAIAADLVKLKATLECP